MTSSAARRVAQTITLPYPDDERCDCDDDKFLTCAPHYEIAEALDAFAAEAVRAERERCQDVEVWSVWALEHGWFPPHEAAALRGQEGTG